MNYILTSWFLFLTTPPVECIKTKRVIVLKSYWYPKIFGGLIVLKVKSDLKPVMASKQCIIECLIGFH